MRSNGMTRNPSGRCPPSEEILAHLRNEPLAAGIRGIPEHIDSCPACAELARNFRATLDSLRPLEQMPPVRDIAPAVMARISAAPQHGAGWTIPLWTALRAAACIVAALGLFYAGYRVSRQALPAAPVAEKEHYPRQGRQDGAHWLAAAQEQDGRWDPVRWGGKREYTVGLTGMSLLALAGSDDEFPEKAQGISRAVAFLLGQQQEDGMIGETFDGAMYNHGIATVALLETYRGNKAPELEARLRSALRFIGLRQLPSGGWGYAENSPETANASISIWPLRALLVSADLGWTDESNSMNRAVRWLVGLVDDNGRFGYERPGQFPQGADALTAMGAYCLLSASKSGVNIDRRVLGQIEELLRAVPARESETDFYRTYFRICAVKEAGDDLNGIVAGLRERILARMRQAGPNKGSWDPEDQWGSVGGRIYSTAMAAMSL